MKTIFRKSISLMLVFAMLFSLTTTAFAASNSPYIEGNPENVVITFKQLKDSTYQVTIRNDRDTAIGDWKLSFKTNFKLSNPNGVSWSMTKNNTYSFWDTANGSIASGDSFSFNVVSDKKKNSEIHNVVFSYENIYISNHLNINKDAFLYDSETNEYYLLKKLDCLSGTLTNADSVNNLSYKVYNEFGHQIEQGSIEVSDNWATGPIGLIPGKNHIVVTAENAFGQVSEEINLYDPLGLNFELLVDYCKDTDGDGLCDYIEDLLGTDKTILDSDGDSISDYQEAVVLGYNPLNPDTDGNGVSDANEDRDGDSLTNAEEYRLGTNPIGTDTDLDGLTDGDEINLYHTNPLRADSDGDGANDLWEIQHGIPERATLFDIEFQVTEISQSGDLDIWVNVSLPGNQVMNLQVEPDLENAYLNGTLPGYLGVPFNIELEGGFSGTAELTFAFEKSLLNDPYFNPVVYYFDEETQLLEELPTSVDRMAGTATTIVSHFSTYILLNKTEFDKVWNEEIKPPTQEAENSALDIVFVIDYSASMASNDPQQLCKKLSKEFVSKLREDIDRAGVVKFIAKASLVSGMTTDKNSLNTAIDSISYDSGYGSYSGTNGSDGIYNALQLLNDSTATYKYIIFLTDGDDNRTSYSYSSLISTANKKDITIYSIGLGSANEATLRTLAEGTNGKYYLATTASSESDNALFIKEVYEKIQNETVDYSTDSNNDGISNYYTKIMCEGKAYINGARNPFYGIPYESVQANNDYDHDGLMNGEEVSVTMSKEGKVYIKFLSDPTRANSDDDIYSDYEEITIYHSNPMHGNIAFKQSDLDYLIENSNFVANDYVEFYENEWYGWSERVGLWIGNKVFGSNYDTTYLYKSILMEYLQQVVQETEEANEIRELYDLTRESLNTMADLTKTALDAVTGDKRDYLENLLQQLNTSRLNMDDLAKIKVGEGGLTKEQIYQSWDKAFQQYRNASNEISTLDHEIRIEKKIGKGAKSIGVVLEVLDVGTTIVDFFNSYSEFATSLSSMDDCINVLKKIQLSSDSPEELKQACVELIRAIEAESAKNMDRFWDGVGQIGGKILRVGASHAVTFIPVVGPYLEAANLILGLGDFVFNVSDVSEQFTCLYAIAKSANVVSGSFDSDISSGELRNTWLNVYENRIENAGMFFNLAMLRKVGENQTKKADLAHSFLIEWLYTEILYKVDEVDANIHKIDAVKANYILAGV